jgi:hypothetical protein
MPEKFDYYAQHLLHPEEAGPLPRIAWYRVTPEMADDLLLKFDNPEVRHNRRRSRPKEGQFSRVMGVYRWRRTGDPLKFALDPATGRRFLMDGQTRLHACGLAKVPFDTVIAWDCDPEAQEGCDGGRSRTVAQILNQVYGVDRAEEMSAWINALQRILPGGRRGRLSADEIFDIIQGHLAACEWIVRLVPRKVPKGQRDYFRAQVFAGLILAYPTALGKLDEFVQAYVSGEHLIRGQPAHALRAEAAETRRQGNAASRDDLAWKTLRAVEAVLDRETVADLRRRPSSLDRFLPAWERAVKAPAGHGKATARATPAPAPAAPTEPPARAPQDLHGEILATLEGVEPPGITPQEVQTLLAGRGIHLRGPVVALALRQLLARRRVRKTGRVRSLRYHPAPTKVARATKGRH